MKAARSNSFISEHKDAMTVLITFPLNDIAKKMNQKPRQSVSAGLQSSLEPKTIT